MLSPNIKLQDRYRIIRHLGQGGMGTVYEAIDERVSAIVAVKETLIGDDEEARKAFRREAELLANLRHPLLPHVTDYFSEDEGSFLVMDFIPGHDLAELLELRGSAFPEAQVLGWADELLKVLQYLHGQRVLHRDIKPSNLKLTRQGEIFLLDFGLAKGAAGEMPTLLTSRSVFGYTPVYASLEQIHGKGTDVRSDLYSLSATLYHLLTGVQPTDAPTRDLAVGEEEPDPLRPMHELNPQVSPTVSVVIHQAMAIRRKGRPESASEMRRLLTEASRSAASSEEERKKQRALDEERQQREEAERERDESLRRSREAEARRREEEEEERRRRQEAEAETRRQREAEEEKSNAAEEARRRRESVDAAPPVTVAAVPPTRKAAPPAKSSDADASMKTLPAPPPVFQLADLESASTVGEAPGATGRSGSKTKLALVIAAGLMVLVVAVIAVRMMNGTTADNATQNNSLGSAPANTQKGLPSPPPGMVFVPGGEFMMGRDKSDGGDEYEHPAHKVTVKPFFIDAHEVTCEEFGKYLEGHTVSGNESGQCAGRDGQSPVTGVTWDDADAYAKWAGKRLPTEEEWEFAARGADKRRYPWGNQWQPGLANANGASKGLAKVGAYTGASPFGAFDMVGNAWEWTASKLAAYPGGRLTEQPSGDVRIIRGGSYDEGAGEATTTYRGFLKARGDKYDKTGFRCVKDMTDQSGTR